MADAREDRFRALYEETRPRILAYVLRRTSSTTDAADIVSEIYETAWRRLEDVPDNHDGPLWLYVTARYVIANYRRRIHRQSAMTTRLADELGHSPLRIEATDEESLVMRFCLSSMSPDDRELLMLAGWEGLSASEIGRVIGCSPTAARIRIHRARARLKSALAESPSLEKQRGAFRHAQDRGVEGSSSHQEVFEQ
jgi:RNA polymerase sigma factor (sigma-70 family)